MTLQGQPELRGSTVVVPADPSSAAFPIVAALITPGSDVIIEGVMMNPSHRAHHDAPRNGRRHRAPERARRGRRDGRRPAGAARRLTGVEVPAGARAVDDRRISGAGGRGLLRAGHHPDAAACTSSASRNPIASRPSRPASRESGVRYEIEGDDLIVHGAARRRRGGGTVATHLDHRIAMASW